MKKLLVAGAMLAAFSGCQREQPEKVVALPREVYVGYAKAGDTLRVARLLATGPNVALHRAVLIQGRETNQRPLPVRTVAPDSVATVQRNLQSRYQWQPVPSSEPAVLFVQMDPKPEHQKESLFNLMAIFNDRDSVEEEISKALEARQLGSWAGGDFGEGGINMLFEVNDVASALPVVLQALAMHHGQGRVRIARQLRTAADDWRYEVIYPIAFSGSFSSM